MAKNFTMKQYVDGAYQAIHPQTTGAQVIQDATHRMVSDVQIAGWEAKQAALGFVPENVAKKNQASGYAGLGADGKIAVAQLPSITITDTFEAGSEQEMLGLTAQTGDICIRTDLMVTMILAGATASKLTDWKTLTTPTDSVTSVNGRQGAVVITLDELGGLKATEVTSTATANKVLRLNADGKLVTDLVGTADLAVKLATARSITITGDAAGTVKFDGSADASMSISLANTGVTAGTYTSVKVDTKGRVVEGKNITVADLNTVTMAIGTSEPTEPVAVFFEIQ